MQAITILFKEQQQFRQKWMYFVYVFLLALVVLFIYADVQQIVFGKPFGDKPASNLILLIITFFIVVLLVLLYIAKLETLITDEGISFRWTPFQKKYRKFLWSEIDKTKIINYGFVGYGWRLTPYGTVYNVDGNRGLQLKLKSGKKIILGTQKPSEISETLQRIGQL